MRKRHIRNIVVSLAVGIVCIFVWLRLIDIPEFLRYIREVNIIYIFPSILFYLCSYFFRSQRLRLLLSHKADIPTIKNYAYYLAANFMNYVAAPIRVAEVVKSLFYKRNHNIRLSESLPPIFLDKVFDTFAIFVVLLMLPFMWWQSGRQPLQFSSELYILMILLIFVFLVGILILFAAAKSPARLVTILQKIFFFFPKKYKSKINDSIFLLVDGMDIFRHHKSRFFPCLTYTFMATLTDSIFFFLMFTAFGVPISYIKILFGYTLIFLSYMLPHPPAQIGSNQLIMILIFAGGFGFNETHISAVMTFSHIVTAIVIFITGFISLAFAGFKFRNILEK